jgi:hypothetical protein
VNLLNWDGKGRPEGLFPESQAGDGRDGRGHGDGDGRNHGDGNGHDAGGREEETPA